MIEDQQSNKDATIMTVREQIRDIYGIEKPFEVANTKMPKHVRMNSQSPKIDNIIQLVTIKKNREASVLKERTLSKKDQTSSFQSLPLIQESSRTHVKSVQKLEKQREPNYWTIVENNKTSGS